MNSMIQFLLLAVLAAVALSICAKYRVFPLLKLQLGKYRVALANDGALTVGIHSGGRISGYSDAIVTTRFLLVKQGSADNHWTPVTSVLDMPVGVLLDEPAAITDQITVQLLNANDGTIKMVANGAIPAGALVVTAGDGTVKAVPSTVGVYWNVGVAVTTAVNNGDLVEVQPCVQQIGVALIT